MVKKVCFVILTTILIGCSSKKKQQVTIVDTKINMNTQKKYTPFTVLNKQFIKKTENWKEYVEVKEFLNQYQNISASEALNNALELKLLTQKLKDSSAIEIMKIPALKARVNVFENEVLRLADMTYIPSISAKEVSIQVEKTLALFSSFNTKINTIYIKKEFDSDIKLDSLFKK